MLEPTHLNALGMQTSKMDKNEKIVCFWVRLSLVVVGVDTKIPKIINHLNHITNFYNLAIEEKDKS